MPWQTMDKKVADMQAFGWPYGPQVANARNLPAPGYTLADPGPSFEDWWAENWAESTGFSTADEWYQYMLENGRGSIEHPLRTYRNWLRSQGLRDPGINVPDEGIRGPAPTDGDKDIGYPEKTPPGMEKILPVQGQEGGPKDRGLDIRVMQRRNRRAMERGEPLPYPSAFSGGMPRAATAFWPRIPPSASPISMSGVRSATY